MTKTKRFEIILILVTVLSLGAGLMAGLLTSRLPASPATQPVPTVSNPLDHTPLVQELNLTAEQREQMKQIWESAKSGALRTYTDAENLQKDRDDAILQILSEEQKAQFQKIAKDYASRYSELQSSRNKVFDQAVAKTLELLNDTQRAKYREILRTYVGPSAGSAALNKD